MRIYTSIKSAAILILLFLLISCKEENNKVQDTNDPKRNESEARTTLQKLLISIENKDLKSLKTTMPPTGKMELIIPGRAIIYTVDEFVELHQNWFKDTTWTMQTNILNLKADQNIAFATADAMYKELERDGNPYFNHMVVSYILEKIDH